MSRPYSSRFATRTARTQRIGQRGKKQACFAQPKGEWGQTWPSLALSRGEQELTCARLGPNLRQTRTQLEPNWGPTWRTFGCKLGLACATWSFVGSGAEVGPKTSPMWATWPRAPISPHQSQKTLEKAVKTVKAANAATGPNLSKSVLTCRSLAPFGDSFAPSWAQRTHNMGNIDSYEASSIAKNMVNTTSIH